MTTVLVEKVDLRRLYYLQQIIDENPQKCLDEWFHKCKSKQDKETELKKVKKYLRVMIQNQGEATIQYHHAQNSKKYGRLFAYPSVQSLKGLIRGFLFYNHTDLDFRNAHPKILEFLCKKHSIVCPNLSYYNANRDDILSKATDKDALKVEFLKSVNSDFKRTLEDPFLKNFDKEMKEIQQHLTSLDCYKDIVSCVPADRKSNKNGSAINHILCDYEAKLLEDMIQVIFESGFTPAVRMFDGCMVEGIFNATPLIKSIENHINSKYDALNIQVVPKPHDTTIELPEDYEIPTAPADDVQCNTVVYPSFEEMAEEFEKTHAKIIAKSMFIHETEETIVFMTADKLRVSFSHLLCTEVSYDKEGNPSYVDQNFIKKWMINNPSMRLYDDVGMYPPPLTCPDNIYNLWRPFRGEEITEYVEMQDELEFMLNHIRVLCNNEDAVYEYFVRWIAQMIQSPAQKSTCITMISKQGAGKGTLMKLLECMMGEKKVMETTNPAKDVWGNHNSLMVDSFFVNLNEVSQKDSYEAEGRIKGLITDINLTINPKGKDQFVMKSYHRWFVTTNHEDGAMKTSHDDRRNLIIRSSDDLIKNEEYFNRIYGLLRNDNFIATCYQYFKTLDLSDFSVRDIPITEYQKDLQELSVSPLELFLQHIVERNTYEDEYCRYAAGLFDEYINFCKSRRFDYVENVKKFAIKLKRLNVEGFRAHRYTTGVMYYFDIEKMKTHFKMADLQEIPDGDSESD